MFHEELSKISKDLRKLSKKIHKLSEKLARKEAKIKKRFKAAPQVGRKLTKPAVQLPDAQRVLEIIRESKQGLDPKAIKLMTGLTKEKVHKILHRLFKQGEIMIESGGLYTGVKRSSGLGK